MTAEPSPNASVESEMQAPPHGAAVGDDCFREAGEAADIVSMRVVRIPEGKAFRFQWPVASLESHSG